MLTSKAVIKLFTLILLSILSACSPPEAKIPTVLIINPLGNVIQFVPGFLEGMTQAGYTDGETVNYVYSEEPESMAPPAIEATVTSALANTTPDIVVCISTAACTVAKAVLTDKTIPMVFMGVTDPIGTGLVTDFTDVENITGIASAARNASNEGRAFEWLMQIAPDTKRVFIPHNPQDPATSIKLSVTQEVAEAMGVEVIVGEATTEEEMAQVVQNIPDDIDAVITYSERVLDVSMMESLNALLIERKIPHLSFAVQYGQMMAYAPSVTEIGQQAAVLTDRILKGTPVSNIPVEVAEFKLYIYLPTVDAMGLEVDDQILRQAEVIRGEGS